MKMKSPNNDSPSSIILNINDLHYRLMNFTFIKIISSQDISPWYPCCMWQDEQSSGCQTYRLYSPSSSLSSSLPHLHLNQRGCCHPVVRCECDIFIFSGLNEEQVKTVSVTSHQEEVCSHSLFSDSHILKFPK